MDGGPYYHRTFNQPWDHYVFWTVILQWPRKKRGHCVRDDAVIKTSEPALTQILMYLHVVVLMIVSWLMLQLEPAKHSYSRLWCTSVRLSVRKWLLRGQDIAISARPPIIKHQNGLYTWNANLIFHGKSYLELCSVSSHLAYLFFFFRFPTGKGFLTRAFKDTDNHSCYQETRRIHEKENPYHFWVDLTPRPATPGTKFNPETIQPPFDGP